MIQDIKNKIGFWPVIGIVIGSQVGSGVFMLPSTMAPYGIFSIYGWIINKPWRSKPS